MLVMLVVLFKLFNNLPNDESFTQLADNEAIHVVSIFISMHVKILKYSHGYYAFECIQIFIWSVLRHPHAK